ncbi:hypothetical protein G6F43_011137 [Rhizopus delemar]|nr:hypothetical protein G6F43_011137 [Rhizopus delemar]
MVLSGKEFLALIKTILHIKPKNLSWVNVVHAGHQKSSSFLAISTNNSTIQSRGVEIGQPDTNAEMGPSNLKAQATRPFLKGSVPNSIFVDITTVKDKKIFLTELTTFCQGNEHLLGSRRPDPSRISTFAYQPLAYSTSATSASLLDDVSINVHAAWSSMKPYCRYCHGDHPLKDCQVRQQATICHWCNESSHIAKFCDRKIAYGASGAPNEKTRKTPIVSATEKSLINSPNSVTSLDKNLVVSDEATVEIALTSGCNTYYSARGFSTVPVVPAAKICLHCKKEGHVRKQHRDCEFFVPLPTKLSGKFLPSNEDTEMMEYPDHSVHTTSNDLANKDDMSIDAQGGIASEHMVALHSVIYAPVTRRDRFVFFDTLAQNRTPLLPDVSSRHLVLGDFSYTHTTHISSAVPRQAPPSWLSYIDYLFQDCVSDKDCAPQETFSRDMSRSCIDYIFGTLDLYDCKMSSNVSLIQSYWSDHFLVTSYFALWAPVHSTVLGKGQWRVYPRLASSEAFRNLVSSTITNTMISFDLSLTPQEKWDMVKSAIAQVAKSFSRRSAFNLTKSESFLHRKRARITKCLASNPELLSSLKPQLSIVESQLASQQQYHAETLALRAGIRWREQGEISVGYLKRTVSQRQTRQIMKQLVHPTTGALYSTSNETLDAAVQFYSNLYSPEPIDNLAIDDLLSVTPNSLRLSDSNQRFLTNIFTYDDFFEGATRFPHRSSPGLDGLPYEILHLILFILPPKTLCSKYTMMHYQREFSHFHGSALQLLSF